MASASDGPLKNCDVTALRHVRYEGSPAVADVGTTRYPKSQAEQVVGFWGHPSAREYARGSLGVQKMQSE